GGAAAADAADAVTGGGQQHLPLGRDAVERGVQTGRRHPHPREPGGSGAPGRRRRGGRPAGLDVPWAARHARRVETYRLRVMTMVKADWPARALAEYRTGRPLVLLFDYDGTLTPIVAHPSLAVLPAPTQTLLATLAGVDGVTVGVVSGRALGHLK